MDPSTRSCDQLSPSINYTTIFNAYSMRVCITCCANQESSLWRVGLRYYLQRVGSKAICMMCPSCKVASVLAGRSTVIKVVDTLLRDL
jgi:hypothetical protein